MCKIGDVSPRVLIVDDDPSFREVMLFHLTDAGHKVDVAPGGQEALKCFESARHAVVVTDLNMPRMDGIALLRELKRRSPDTVIVVITAFGEMATAVEAMKAGAYDFLPKPCERDHFKLTIARAMEHWSLKAAVEELTERVGSSGKELIYVSAAMARVVAMADRVAPSEGTVLLLGDSGTGKELLARRVHRKSPRRDGPFVAFNCAAIAPSLMESELFGHVRGAFTDAIRDRKGRFEQAHGGTVFLDEVGDVPPDLQLRLLRVLQERVVDVIGKSATVNVDVRVIAATNRDLRKDASQGLFREDLYFRLAVIPIQIPPLRDRPEDIPVLVEHFLRRYAPDRQLTVADTLMARFRTSEWRGNVRELENFCHRMALLAEDDVLTEDILAAGGDLAAAPSAPERRPLDLPAEGLSLLDLERDVIVRALEMNAYNQTKTAKFLRIPRHILLYRAEKYQIPLRGTRS